MTDVFNSSDLNCFILRTFIKAGKKQKGKHLKFSLIFDNKVEAVEKKSL